MASTPSPRWAPLPVGFGVLIRNARIDAGMSRETLAAVLRVSRGQVQGVEEGLRPPATEIAERLCDALALDPWKSAVVLAAAVDTGALRSRRGVRHTHVRGTPLPDFVRTYVTAERARGSSWRSIAAGLNRAGVPGVQGGQWWASSVSRERLVSAGE